MLKNYVINNILSHLPFDPTDNQQELVEKLANLLTQPEQSDILIVNGYAGTGKTTIISAFIKYLSEIQNPFKLLAPTGRAAKVLTNYSGHNAYTIHKEIYRQAASNDDFGAFDRNINLHKGNLIFIVDETSMIANDNNSNSTFGTGRLLDDLIYYVFQKPGNKLILIGDQAQLPPIGKDESPALNKDIVAGYGLNTDNIQLTQVVRQASDSGILYNATTLRNIIDSEVFGQFPKINTKPFPDIERINGENLIDSINQSYDIEGMSNTIIITRSNKRANLFNKGIRNSILYREEEITAGDYIMIVKNNYFWSKEFKELDFIANGDIAEITRINGYHEIYKHRYADVSLRLLEHKDFEIDARILLTTLHEDTAALSFENIKKLYYTILEDYPELTNRGAQYKKMREDPFYNSLQVKFAYSVTCHKAQGGQWKHVYLDQGYVTEEMVNKEYFRWLYTGFTRATEKLYLVNFPDKFFD